MRRRFPTALLLTVGLLSVAAHAAGEPVRAPILSVSLSGGFSYRDTTYLLGAGQAQTTRINGISPWIFRLRADWFPLTWLGLEGEASGDFFRAIPEEGKPAVDTTSQRGFGRLGPSLRWLTDSGFLLSGSVGYGLSSAPVVRIATVGGSPLADGLLSHGPVGRVSLGFSTERFEALAGVVAMLAVNRRVNSLEPQLWLAGRVADVGPTAFWVGVDGGLLLEAATDLGYSGPTLRVALAVKLQLLPPKPPGKPVLEDPKSGTTTLKVKVTLPDGAPAIGALVALDGAAPVPVDALGELSVKSTAGAHTANAKLSGYRAATGTVTVVADRETTLPLRLEALTGPGQLSGIVRGSATGKPVAEATVTAGDGPSVQTGEDGSYRFENVGPGPLRVRIEAQGFTAADEVAQVPPESAATLDVQLEPLGKGSPATVRGLIRSHTGEAIKATVSVKTEAGKKVATKVQVTPEGRFFVTVPGGTYQFVISAPGYLTQTKKVVLADGDQAIVHTELQKVSR